MKTNLLTIVFLALLNTVLQAQPKERGFIISEDKTLNESELEAFHEIAEQRVSEFQQYLKIISSKLSASKDKDDAGESALKLFIPNAKIDITYKKNNVILRNTSYPIGDYFSRLRALTYAKVEITFFSLSYVGKFTKGKDGKYYASATIFQEFTGFVIEGKIKYTDKQMKTIDLIMEYKYDQFYDEWQWTVLLGDIKAIDTPVE